MRLVTGLKDRHESDEYVKNKQCIEEQQAVRAMASLVGGRYSIRTAQ